MVRVVEVRWSHCKLFWIISWLVVPLYSADDIDCESPQYVKLGQQGVISCTFPETFHGIYWYDRENVTSDDRPFISYIGGLKSGPGFDSHEYDIHPNGSLIINNVSVLHNHFYGVTVLESVDRDAAFKPVSVKVFENGTERRVLLILLVICIPLLILLLIVGLILFCKRRHRDQGVTVLKERGRLAGKGCALLTDKRGRVVLSSKDSEDTHRRTLQLLKNVPESKVKLANSFLSVENNGSALRLTSNVLVEPIATMIRLDFDFTRDRLREFDETEVENILQYVAHCKALKDVSFVNSLLPLELPLDSVKKMKMKAIIEWTPGVGDGVKRLNFKTGKWEGTSGELLTIDYAKIIEKVRLSKNHAAEQPGEEIATKPLIQDGDAQADRPLI